MCLCIECRLYLVIPCCSIETSTRIKRCQPPDHCFWQCWVHPVPQATLWSQKCSKSTVWSTSGIRTAWCLFKWKYTMTIYIHFRNILITALDLKPVPTLGEVEALVHIEEKVHFAERESTTLLTGPIPEELLWKATFQHNVAHNMFLCPPVSVCVDCGASLQVHHQPTTVVCYTWNGPIPALKLTLRCEVCRLNYRYEQYGNKERGYQYYQKPQPMVHASQVAYVDRLCCAHMGAAGLELISSNYMHMYWINPLYLLMATIVAIWSNWGFCRIGKFKSCTFTTLILSIYFRF